MIVYLAVLFILMGLFSLTFFIKNKKLQHLLCSLIPAVILFFLLGLKGSSVGADSQTYANAYHDLASIPSFPNPEFFISLNAYNFRSEYGFILFAQLFSKTGLPYLVFQLFIYSIICFSLFFSIWKMSKNAIGSIVVFYCFTFFTFFISGLRQSFAISLCLLAISIIVSGGKTLWRTIAYFLLVGMAVLWHKSAFVCVFCYFVINIKIGFKGFLSLIFASVFLYLFSAEMYEFINGYVSYILGGNLGDYAPLSFGKGLTSILLLSLIAFSYFIYTDSKPKTFLLSKISEIPFYKHSKITSTEELIFDNQNNEFGFKREMIARQNDYFSFFILMSFIGVWLMYTSSYSIAFGRINMYFSIFIIFLLPNAMEKIKNIRIKNTLLIVAAIAFAFYFVYTTVLPNYLGIAPYVLIEGTI